MREGEHEMSLLDLDSEGAVGGERPAKVCINKVSIRTPPFCSDKPLLWFASLEAQFEINRITAEKTKYSYAVAHLDTKCTREVEDIICQPPKIEPYTKLKEAIVSRFSVSYEEKVRMLLEKEQIGDRKPSSFLRHLRSLAGPAFPDQLLRSIWSSRLPRQVQLMLTTQKQQDISDIADLADQLIELTNVEVCQLSPPSSSNNDALLLSLQEQVAELTRVVASLSTSKGISTEGRFRGRSSSRNRSRSRSRPRNNQLCWYHNRFAAKAHKCEEPCSWGKDAGTGTSQGNHNSGR